MKKKYEPAELEIVWLGASDIITNSPPSGEPDEEETQGSIGGGYNPGGWT